MMMQTKDLMDGLTSNINSDHRGKIALEEEGFNKELTNIVRRDFFPDVEKLETYLVDGDGTPVDSNIRTASMDRLQDSSTHKNIDGGTAVLGLDHFLNKYESEDDASFTDVLTKSSEIHKQKYAWLHEKEEEYAKIASGEKLAVVSNSEIQRRAGLDSWTYTAKNSLMYVPDGVESSAVESVQSAIREREIVHSNTRLPRQFIQKYQHDSNLDHTKKSVQEKVGVDGKTSSVVESPRINGYGFLTTPMIHPGVDASPLMTWGSIVGTPIRIDSDSVPHGPLFKMPKIHAREKVGLKLADQVAKASRERRKMTVSPLTRERIGTTPSKSDRLRLLSPAVRKLVGQKLKLSDKALSASYSPGLGSGVNTPSSMSKPTPTHNNTPHLTDNLLHLAQ